MTYSLTGTKAEATCAWKRRKQVMKVFSIYPPKLSHGDQRTVWDETIICKFWKTFPLKIAIGGMKFPVAFPQAVMVTSFPFPHRYHEYTALLPFSATTLWPVYC
jgi:hypothetical protein